MKLDRLWHKIIIVFIRLVTARRSAAGRLAFLFEAENRLYALEGEAAICYGKGVHPKHRVMNYHKFFIDNIKPGESVLDVGCGNGEVSYDIARSFPGSRVVGIDINKKKIEAASKKYIQPNLVFQIGDVLALRDIEEYDVIILSNVLEHIKDRGQFLMVFRQKAKPKRYLIRVPLFERDWRVPLKRELGVDYRLDPTHCIEYTLDEFMRELDHVGLIITNQKICWGELWCIAQRSRELTHRDKFRCIEQEIRE